MPALIAFQQNLIVPNFQLDIILLNAQREAPTYRSWRKQALPGSAPAQVLLPLLQVQVLLGSRSGSPRAVPGREGTPGAPRAPLAARELHLCLLYLSSLRSAVGFHRHSINYPAGFQRLCLHPLCVRV